MLENSRLENRVPHLPAESFRYSTLFLQATMEAALNMLWTFHGMVTGVSKYVNSSGVIHKHNACLDNTNPPKLCDIARDIRRTVGEAD